MNLKEIGEFGFIERFKPMFAHLVPSDVISIGDDCAIIPANDREDWLVTTDLLMEDVHFLRDAITPEQLGYKALAVNLSDIAAMGGTPIGSFLSIAIPADMEVEYLDGIMRGFHILSEKYNCPLLGGDTTKSVKKLAINVCVMGKCARGTARQRSMAQVGDAICCTGLLGDSAGGLQSIFKQARITEDVRYLIEKHHAPEPRMAEGQWLATQTGVQAMMDISDGIASDLKHILKASGVGASLQLDAIPLSRQLQTVSQELGFDALEQATGGGEDYELLLTVATDRLPAVQKSFQEKFGKMLYCIGSVTEGAPEISWYRGDEAVQFGKSGFNHFQ